MNTSTFQERPCIEWGVAARALPGQTVSGDLHLVKPFSKGVLLAAVDGLGHGDEATVAAQLAVTTLGRNAEESILSLVNRCHEALRQTRGVVLTLASLHTGEGTLSWLGVGNVEGRLLRADPKTNPQSESVLLRGGVVGYQLPALRASVQPISPGDLLVFATDGIRAGFTQGLALGDPPQQIADGILARHLKGNDDALVFVARIIANHD